MPAPHCLKTRAGRNLVAALLLAPVPLLPTVQAQSIESSWFEIEILTFSRDNSQRLLEQFPAKVTEVVGSGELGILVNAFGANSLRPLLEAEK